jgi:hypothetical protein
MNGRFLAMIGDMLNSRPCSIACVESKYRTVAETLFPPKGYGKGKFPTFDEAQTFAEMLGVGAEYKRLLAISDPGSSATIPEFKRFLAHFQNNLALLISKTWVEKVDEARKERLQYRLPSFVKIVETGDYQAALKEFGSVLEELAFLFFGNQSLQDDFTEYTLRIDTQMGLFWWYGSQIKTQEFDMACGIQRALLLIGICYLTNF